jgi:hypothetical protein
MPLGHTHTHTHTTTHTTTHTHIVTQELLGETPWGSCEGQSLANSLVHWEDVSILENMWLEAQVSQNPEP